MEEGHNERGGMQGLGGRRESGRMQHSPTDNKGNKYDWYGCLLDADRVACRDQRRQLKKGMSRVASAGLIVAMPGAQCDK